MSQNLTKTHPKLSPCTQSCPVELACESFYNSLQPKFPRNRHALCSLKSGVLHIEDLPLSRSRSVDFLLSVNKASPFECLLYWGGGTGKELDGQGPCFCAVDHAMSGKVTRGTLRNNISYEENKSS